MKPRLSLREQVLLLALANAVLLAVAFFWFSRTQLTHGLGELLLSESRERITEVALQLGGELPRTAVKDRDAMLERYSAKHGVTFRLFGRDGTQLAGPQATLPRELYAHFEAERARTPLLDSPQNLARMAEGTKALRQKAMEARKEGRLPFDPFLFVVRDPPWIVFDQGTYWVALRMPIRSHDDDSLTLGQAVLSTSSFFGTPFFFNLTPWLALLAIVVAIILVCWLPLVRGVNRAIATLAGATAKIAKGDFSAKVDIRRADELGQLGKSLNRMSDQLEGYVNGQKRFLRDAAHELRSPLGRMQAALGNIQENPVSPEMAPLLDDLREEIEHMSSLTSDLIAFAREEVAAAKLSIVPVGLQAVAQRAVAKENPDGLRDVRVQVDEGIRVLAHGESLFRGLSNAVRNAIHHAGDAGPITLRAARTENHTLVTVSDNGPGLPEEALEMIFTPFYRLDVSRNRSTGGNGLGMSITRTCAENCGGTVHCRNANPGLEVVFTLKSA